MKVKKSKIYSYESKMCALFVLELVLHNKNDQKNGKKEKKLKMQKIHSWNSNEKKKSCE